MRVRGTESRFQRVVLPKKFSKEWRRTVTGPDLQAVRAVSNATTGALDTESGCAGAGRVGKACHEDYQGKQRVTERRKNK